MDEEITVEEIKKPPKKTIGSFPIFLALPLIGIVCCVMIGILWIIISPKNRADVQDYWNSIPADELTGLKSSARIYWLGGGLIEVNIQTIDVVEPQEVYDWDLKLVLDPESKLTQHFHEKESEVGILTLVQEGNGVYVFEPMFPQFLLIPWIEHNFQFRNVDVEPGMNLQMYLLLHLESGDHEVPIHIVNP